MQKQSMKQNVLEVKAFLISLEHHTQLPKALFIMRHSFDHVPTDVHFVFEIFILQCQIPCSCHYRGLYVTTWVLRFEPWSCVRAVSILNI